MGIVWVERDLKGRRGEGRKVIVIIFCPISE
jgi:hypothetical protein